MSGILAEQAAALHIGSRARQEALPADTVATFNVTVYGPNGRKIAGFIVANSTAAAAVDIVKKQITIKTVPVSTT